jgi:hypothetical protein
MGKSLPFTVNMMKIKYCESNKYSCARYKLRHVFEITKIPVDLWSDDKRRGMELLEDRLNESQKDLNGCSREEVSI